jgi:ketosteroid isomerase-like protein
VTDRRVYRGLDGVREFFRDWLGVWDEYGSEVEEWIDAGEHVIAVVHLWGRGKQSRVAVEQRRSHLWTRRDGKLRRRRIYAAKADALEAAGLRE